MRETMSATILTIDLDRVVQNYNYFKTEVQKEATKKAERSAAGHAWYSSGEPAEVAAVLKADGYGLGAEQIGKALANAGCGIFFVAHGFEGVALRSALPDAVIYVFHGAMAGEEALFKEHGLIPVVNSEAQLKRYAEFAAQQDYNVLALHVDTGMNRLGLKRDEFQKLCAAPEILEGLDVRLILSHLACADVENDPKNQLQLAEFDELMQARPSQLKSVPLSLANSAGVLLGPSYHYDLSRVGIGLYGGNPFSDRGNPFSPVVKLETEILKITRLEAGETVSYGSTWQAERPSVIATIGVGYADGFIRAGGLNGVVVVGGKKAPIVGRVTMDLMMVDVTDLVPDGVSEGDMVELLGDKVTVEHLADRAGTIGYEILTALGSRYQRRYIGG